MANLSDIKLIIPIDADTKPLEISLDEFVKKANGTGKKIGDEVKKGVGKTDILGGLVPSFKQLKDASEKALDRDFLGALKSLPGPFKAAATAAAAAAGAFKVVGLALDKVISGEKINQINQNFDFLAQQAGLATNDLRSSFASLNDGLVSGEALLQASSAAIVKLEGNASRLPAVFDLAKKASAISGQDIIQTYEQITNAIATGNTKALRSVGIILDQDEVYKKYSKTVGIAVDQLNTFDKQQAVLNATLEKARTTFAGINTDVLQTGNALTRFKNAIGSISDEISIRLASSVGGPLATAFNFLANKTKEFADSIKSDSKKSVEELEASIDSLNKKIIEVSKPSLSLSANLSAPQRVAEIKNEIRELTNLLNLRKSERNDEARRVSQASGDKIISDNARIAASNLEASEAQNKIILEAEQFKSNLASQSLQNRIAQAEAENNFELANSLKLQQLEIQNQQNLANIRKQFEGKILDDGNTLRTLIEQETQRHEEAKSKIVLDAGIKRNEDQQKLNDALRSALQSGLSRTAASFGKALQAGENAFDALSKGIVSIIGDILVSLGNAMIAIGLSKIKLDSLLAVTGGGFGIIATGAGLIALGSILGASVGDTLTDGANPQSSSNTSPVDASTDIGETEVQKPGTEVVVNVQGNVLDRRETGLFIAEVIRENFETQGIVGVGA